jgi:hypothetical protein
VAALGRGRGHAPGTRKMTVGPGGPTRSESEGVGGSGEAAVGPVVGPAGPKRLGFWPTFVFFFFFSIKI